MQGRKWIKPARWLLSSNFGVDERMFAAVLHNPLYSKSPACHAQSPNIGRAKQNLDRPEVAMLLNF